MIAFVFLSSREYLMFHRFIYLKNGNYESINILVITKIKLWKQNFITLVQKRQKEKKLI